MKLNKENKFQVNKLMSILINKLVITTYKAGKQYSLVKSNDSETKNLIKVLLMQIITWLRIKLATNNLMLYIMKKTTFFNNFNVN